MTAPFVHVYDGVQGMKQKIASVVIDQDEFNTLVDKISKSDIKNYQTGEPAGTVTSAVDPTKTELDFLKEEGLIPFIKRGRKTNWIFEQFGIDASISVCCIIVRGRGRDLLKEFVVAINQCAVEMN